MKRGCGDSEAETEDPRQESCALRLPLEVLQEHAALDTIDLLFLMIALDRANRFVVVESLAGCGKTTMLTDLVCRINNPNAVLLLSFTKAAVRVARVRMMDRGQEVKTQTFDSLFFHAVRHSLGSFYDGLDYQEYRDLSQTLSSQDLEDFECKARVRYRLQDVQYIMVDEAQDTPPEAFLLLQAFREMGKTVLVTGDRNQAIFRSFMGTNSLFDQIPRQDSIFHCLHKTRRCGEHVVEYIRQRFSLPMVAAASTSVHEPSVKTVCVQARSNRTLARLYGTMLFSMDCPAQVYVAQESNDKFYECFYQDVAKRYGCDVDQAKEVAEHRIRYLKGKHRVGGRSTALVVFSTVHHFKGGEADVTVLADDIEPDTNNGDADDEMVKYVACTRARWGIIDMKTWKFYGNPAIRPLLASFFHDKHAHHFTNSVSAASHMPLCVLPLIVDPVLEPILHIMQRCFQPLPPIQQSPLPDTDVMCVGSYCDILLSWNLEGQAVGRGVRVETGDVGAYRVTVEHDRRYRSQYRRGRIPVATHQRMVHILADLRLASLFARYLVVKGAVPWTSPLAYRGCMARNRLQSYMLCKNLMILDEPWPTRKCYGRVLTILDRIADEGLPGVLGTPSEWDMLLLQQPMNPGPLHLRGIFDILVVDRTDRRHLFEVKAVRQLMGGHVLQTLMYAALLRINTGVEVDHVHLYELCRNQVVAFPPEQIQHLVTHLTQDPTDVLVRLNKTLSAKHTPLYYNENPTWT